MYNIVNKIKIIKKNHYLDIKQTKSEKMTSLLLVFESTK